MSFLIQAIDASDNTISGTISDISDISVIEWQPRSAKPHTHYQLRHKSNVVDHTLSPPHDEWALANLSVKKQLDFSRLYDTARLTFCGEHPAYSTLVSLSNISCFTSPFHHCCVCAFTVTSVGPPFCQYSFSFAFLLVHVVFDSGYRCL